MKKIIVASKNPVKIEATILGFSLVFPNENFEVKGVAVSSGISNQPLSNSETLQGAKNRVDNAYNLYPDADFWVGIEGGVEKINSDMESFAWIFIKSKDGIRGKSRTSTFFLPPQVINLVLKGKELGEADDIVFKRHNSKQANGAVGILTDNIITRTSYYKEAVVLALIPFKNTNLYE